MFGAGSSLPIYVESEFQKICKRLKLCLWRQCPLKTTLLQSCYVSSVIQNKSQFIQRLYLTAVWREGNNRKKRASLKLTSMEEYLINTEKTKTYLPIKKNVGGIRTQHDAGQYSNFMLLYKPNANGTLGNRLAQPTFK